MLRQTASVSLRRVVKHPLLRQTTFFSFQQPLLGPLILLYCLTSNYYLWT